MKGFVRSLKTGIHIFILFGVISSLVTFFLYWYKPTLLEAIDLKASDARFLARGASHPGDDVVIVAVDERSINELGRWPWSRAVMARLMESLASAKVVALDIVFSETESKTRDVALAEAIRGVGNVVMGYFFREDATEEVGEWALSQMERSRIKAIKLLDDVEEVPIIEFPAVEANIREIGEGASGFGSFNIIPDHDGIYRNAQLLFLFDGALYPSLALEALRHYIGGEIIVQLAAYGVDDLSIREYHLPLDEGGGFTLNFYGGGGTIPTYSAAGLLKGEIPPEAIEGKLVFIGVTEKGVYDIRAVPLDPLFPGVETHATVAANTLQRRFLIRDSRVVGIDVISILFLPLLLSVIIGKVHRTFTSLLIFGGILSLSVLVNFFLFVTYGITATVIYPLLAVSLSYLSLEAYRNIVVEGKSRYLKKAFSTYISQSVVTEILKDPDKLQLGGEKREVTMLFSDIRAFTSISERLQPEELVQLLNNYLSPMTEIVLREGGTLDKYIGDAIMVIFNAPVDLPDHPKRACTVALTMMEKLEVLNRGWRERGYLPIFIGIGVNTGDAVVGNMGADLRFDYTAIGDAVNLASRLEGMNKLYGTSILVSEDTRRRVADDFLFREIDTVRVKGREKGVAIFELMDFGRGNSEKAELADRFTEALVLYKRRAFAEAAERFRDISKAFPEDGATALYIRRCEEYIAAPPPDGWDGVYVAETK
ncbi:MAG: CHASE2 domain-containing protein [Thermodesulfobacteriota bacterium]